MNPQQASILEPANGAVPVALAAEIVAAEMIAVGREGRFFPMNEMPALNMAGVIDLVVSEAQTWLRDGILTETDLRVDARDLPALLPLLTKLLSRVPDVFAKLITLTFDLTDEADGQYIVKHITLRQLALAIVAFMRVNAWEDVVDNFFLIGSSFQKVRTRLNPGPATS